MEDIMAGKKAKAEEKTFDQQLARVKEIVAVLEGSGGEQVDLETGARLYKEASACLAFCRERLDTVRNEIENSDTGEIAEDVPDSPDAPDSPSEDSCMGGEPDIVRF